MIKCQNVFFLPFQNKSLKHKLMSGNKLCDTYADEVRRLNQYIQFYDDFT